jgi:cob(I)alamin adenosyltransferase
MESVVKLYTRGGDAGETSLVGGARVSKADRRVEAYGEVDELNAWLGFVRAFGLGQETDDALAELQRDLFALGARLADPAGKVRSGLTKTHLDDDDVARLERLIDRFDAETPPLEHFVLAGGVPAGAALHVARTVCRRAERHMVALEPAVDPVLLRYVNRLSDLLFALARAVNHRAGVRESEW